MRKQNALLSLILALVMALSLLAGCSELVPSGEKSSEVDTSMEISATEAEDESSEAAASTEEEAEASQDESAHYPVEIITYNQDREEVKTVYSEAPKKVLAIYQSSVDNLLALGLEDHILAIAGLDMPVKEEYTEIYKKLTDLDWEIPSKEKVLEMKPDMILSWFSLFNLGKIFNVEEKAEAIVQQMKDEIAEAQKLVEEFGRVLAVGTPRDILKPELIRELYQVESKILEDPETGQRAISYF